ncbi:NAD(P)/FAD-dependent oxidoreductase [Streptomyces sp. NPDC004629]|uniref:NAD(P)/FAD-dependent oxidoreductase n=1 Tax=Streptomyces sp. NPDC004629 TaxID=3364705 RepID=UPI0036A7DF97
MGAMSKVMSDGVPRRVAVVGAGMVGLCTAWYLQEYGVEVTVLDRARVASGSSWGNAGWLTPGMATPLPGPEVLKYGLRAVLEPSSPVYVPPSASPRLLRFLAGFVGNSTQGRWDRAMAALAPLNRAALEAFAEIEATGLKVTSRPAEPFTIAFRGERSRQAILEELEHIQAAGQPVDFDLLDADDAIAAVPALSGRISCAVALKGQRFIDPGAFVRALAEAVVSRGGVLREGAEVARVAVSEDGARVGGARYDAVTLATGAQLNATVRPFGVRRIVQAGRGYSFSVKTEKLPDGPVYFPAERLACTPLGDRLRVAGMMEFRPADAPLDRRRIAAMTTAVEQLLDGLHLDDRSDEWVGSRPCTTDGLPLIGRTRHPRVFVAGGHGMWGITLGPVTGKLLAQQIVSGRTPRELRAVDPLR